VERALLQDSQQLALVLGPQLADLVRKIVPPSACSK
jgi:hypothetical protein